MKRRQLVELHELRCCPTEVRDTLTDILQLSIRIDHLFAPTAELLPMALNKCGAKRIVDLCSGGGGPWPDLASNLKCGQEQVAVQLTDKFPNADARRRVSSFTNVRYNDNSVDATAVPPELDGFRTMFSSFHHFTPQQARQIMANAVAQEQGIAVFEFTRRDSLSIVRMLFSALIVLLFVPFLRPFRWQRLLWTYLIPLVPLVLTFDGVVSCLRTYSVAELEAFAAQFPTYDWRVGEIHREPWRFPLIYLIGYPRRTGVKAQTKESLAVPSPVIY